MGPFIFVIIAAIAVFPTLMAFKFIAERLKSGDISRERGMINFFISVAIIEIIPILFIVYAFTNLNTVSDMNEIIIPLLLILVFSAVGGFFIFLQGIVGVAEEDKAQMRLFSMIGFALMNAVPIICITGLFMMLS